MRYLWLQNNSPVAVHKHPAGRRAEVTKFAIHHLSYFITPIIVILMGAFSAHYGLAWIPARNQPAGAVIKTCRTVHTSSESLGILTKSHRSIYNEHRGGSKGLRDIKNNNRNKDGMPSHRWLLFVHLFSSSSGANYIGKFAPKSFSRSDACSKLAFAGT